MPFRFCAIENVACYFCDVIDTYEMVLQHQEKSHPNESIVIVSTMDRKKCGLCPYSGEALIGHFEIEHELLLQLNNFNPLQLNDNTLNRLLEVDILKRYCEFCVKIYDTEMEAIKHFATDHQNKHFNQKPTKSSNIECLICLCQKKIENIVMYFTHIQQHFNKFVCTKCNCQLDNLIDLVDHDKITHQINSMKFHCLDLSDKLMKYYFSTKMLFSTGFVLNMHNLLHTKFDSFKQFENMIDQMSGKMIDKQTINHCDDNNSDDNEKIIQTNSSSNSLTATIPVETQLKIQNRFANDLAIEGIPTIEGENVLAIFMAICKTIHVNITSSDIVFIRRSDKNRIIHVRLNDRTEFLRCRYMKNLKTAHFMDLPAGTQSTQIYINKFMTKYFCNLCQIAKNAMKKRKLFRYNLSSNGVFVQRTKHCHGKYVLSESQLRNYIE